MILYSIQFSLFLAVFLAVYFFFFRKETFFQYNRIYLILAPILAIVLPLLSFNFLQEQVAINQKAIQLPTIFLGDFSSTEKVMTHNEPSTESFSGYLNLENCLAFIYVVGFLVSCLIFYRKIHHLKQLRKKSRPNKFLGTTYFEVPQSKLAFTFFNQIFLGEEIQAEEKQQILQHELVHVKQLHSLDLLFFEILKLVFWFHPGIYFCQNQLKTLHEFIADQKVLQFSSKQNYYESLLNSVFNTEKISFINQFFNHSLIKKRIVMLQKTHSTPYKKLKFLLLIPLIFGMLTYVSCSEDNKINETEYKTKDIKVSEMPHNQIIDHYWKELDSLYDNTENYGQLERKFFYKTLGDTYNPFFSIKFYYKKEVYFIWLEDKENHDKVSNKYDIEPFDEYVKSLNKHGLLFDKIESYKNPMPFTMVDKIPYYKECREINKKEDLLKCTSNRISEYILEGIKKREELSGGTYRVFAEFTIDKNGNSTDVDIRTSNSILSNNIREIIKSLPVFIPGEKNGNKVNVRFTLPIIFKADK